MSTPISPLGQEHPVRHAMRSMTHYDICVMMHTAYKTYNGYVGRNLNSMTEKDWEEKQTAEKVIRYGNAELRGRGVRYEPIYEVMWRVTIGAEKFEFWVPYHAVKPDPRYPSGRPTRNDMISNFHEMERGLESIRPGLSKETRTESKFVTTRKRQPW